MSPCSANMQVLEVCTCTAAGGVRLKSQLGVMSDLGGDFKAPNTWSGVYSRHREESKGKSTRQHPMFRCAESARSCVQRRGSLRQSRAGH